MTVPAKTTLDLTGLLSGTQVSLPFVRLVWTLANHLVARLQVNVAGDVTFTAAEWKDGQLFSISVSTRGHSLS
jgi:hypothetical protein